MKTKINFLVLIILFTLPLFAQNWDIYIGNSGTKEFGEDIVETYDKGILYVIGMEDSVWFTKTTINGDVLWKKSLSNGESISPYAIIETSDHGYAFLGAVIINQSYASIVVKFNSCFEKEWCRILPLNDYFQTPCSILENSDHLLLITTQTPDIFEAPINLYALTLSGDFLWKKNYVTQEDYPDMNNQRLFTMKQINGEYYGVGMCFVPHPTIPNNDILKHLLVRIGADFQEKWALTYGNSDFRGSLNDIIVLDEENHFYLFGDLKNDPDFVYDEKLLIIEINSDGDNLGYHIVENDSIQTELKSTSLQTMEITDNNKIVASGSFRFSTNLYDNNFGEIVFDTSGNVYHFQNFPDYIYPYVKLEKTSDNYYLEGATYDYQNGDWDAYLHKHDANLDPAPINTDPIEYDYLCPDIIETEDIVLDDCVIVGIEDLPTPKEYYARIATIPIWIYPTPASNIVHFVMENTEHHNNITLQVFDLNGRPIEQQDIQRGQKEATTNVSHWQSGMYAVVVFSEGKVVGKEKFVVR